jgi:ferredoxin
LVRDYNLEFNILKASVTPREEGLLVLELSGEVKNYEEGMRYLAGVGVEVQSLSQDVKRNEERCTHCGACVVICPTGALALDLATRRVNFDDTKCIACGLCVLACPPRAMEVLL